MANCHCSECRRANGSAFVTWVGIPETNLKLVSGKNFLCKYAYPKTKEAVRQLCERCGSQLFFKGKRWPNEVHVTRASIERGLDKEIHADVFYSDKAKWYSFEKNLPKLGGKTGVEKL